MHTDLTFRIDSLADHSQRTAWLDLLRDIFGIDLSAFSRLDVWSKETRAFCYMDGDRIAAHVSCRPLPLIVAGQSVLAGQLHGVATRPEFRRRGLFSDLMHQALQYCDERFACVLLYTETPNLYRRFGFRALIEHGFRGKLTANAQMDAIESRHLSPTVPDDRALIRRLFAQRQPVSRHLGLCRNEDIFVANALAHPAWQLSYITTDDALVIWDRVAGRSRLIDIAAPRLPSTWRLVTLLGSAEIDVLFPPDCLDGSFRPVPHVPEDHDILMVRGPFPIEGTPFMLPPTALS